MNNKGDSGIPQLVVLMILGITLFMLTGATYYKVFVESQKSKDSFETLAEQINALKDGESLDYTLYLDASDILISFSGGEDYVGPANIPFLISKSDCEQGETIKISPSCGSDYPCLCICDTSLQYEFEESCTEHELICSPFLEKDFSFADQTCPSGVYREGMNNGILQLHIQLKDNVLTFCENQDCIMDDHKETTEKFSTFINEYKSCLASESSCTCDFDSSFLTSGYALNFYSDKIELYDAIAKTPIVSEKFTTNIASSIPENEFTDLISLYLFEDFSGPQSTAEFGLEGTEYYVISTSIDDISLSGSLTAKQTPVHRTTLLFKDNKLYFTPEDLSQYPSCKIDQRINI